MDFPKNSALKNINQIKGCDVMESPIIAAQKAHNQNIAEKPLLDKMETVEKEFANLSQQIPALSQQMARIVQAVEAGTISEEEAQKDIERIEEELARHRTELKLTNDRLLTLETAIDTIIETEDESTALLNNVKSIFMRFDKLEDKIKKIDEKNQHGHIAIKEYLEDRLDNIDKHFFYLYLLFGIMIVALGISIFVHR